jgi:hypothetical protein
MLLSCQPRLRSSILRVPERGRMLLAAAVVLGAIVTGCAGEADVLAAAPPQSLDVLRGTPARGRPAFCERDNDDIARDLF